MRELGKFVRFCFGIQALSLIGGIPTLVIAVFLVRKRAAWNNLPRPHFFGSMIVVSLCALLLDLVPAIAWWALKKGKPSGRAWALAASVASLPFPIPGLEHIRSWSVLFKAFHLPVSYAGAFIGVAGMVAFSRRQAADAIADAPKPERMFGDGTSGYKDRIASALGVLLLVLSYYWWTRWGALQHLPRHGMLLGLVELQFAVLISTLGHELGHLLAGWLSDMKLRSFQVGPFHWTIRNGRWKYGFQLNSISGGAVGMVPIHLKNIRGREAFMILGGPVASLLMGTFSGVAALSAKGHAWQQLWAFLSMMAVISSVSFVVNLIPQKPEAQYSDGAQIYQLVTNGPWAQVHLAFAMVASSLVTSLRPRDFDIALINRAGDFIAQSERGMLLRLFGCMHYVDAGNVPGAAASLEQAEKIWDPTVVRRPAGICGEFVFFCAVFKRDRASAELWWQRLESLGKVEYDADYWKARASIMWLRNQPAEAFHAWKQGNALAAELPDAGAYQFTRSCFENLRAVLDTAAPQTPVPVELESLKPLPLGAAR